MASLISGGGDFDATVLHEMLCIVSDPKDMLDSVCGRSAVTSLGRVWRQLTEKRLANSCTRALGCRLCRRGPNLNLGAQRHSFRLHVRDCPGPVNNFLYQYFTIATLHGILRRLDHACDRQTGDRLPPLQSLHRHGGFFLEEVKCWAMLAVDTLVNYSSAVRKRRGLLLLDFPTDALLRGLSYPHHRTDASVYPCYGWQSEVTTSLWKF